MLEPDKDVRQACWRLRSWITHSSEQLSQVNAENSLRVVVGGSFFHLAIEHQDAICTLAETGLHASALALFRPLTEATYRGLWMAHVADDKAIDKFLLKETLPDRKAMIAQIAEALPSFTGLSAAYDQAFQKIPHGLTHGGRDQIMARIRNTTIAENHAPENLVVVYNWTALFGKICAVTIAGLAEDYARIDAIENAFSKNFP